MYCRLQGAACEYLRCLLNADFQASYTRGTDSEGQGPHAFAFAVAPQIINAYGLQTTL